MSNYNSDLQLTNNKLQEIYSQVKSLPDIPIYQEKTIIPTANEQEVVADAGYAGLSQVIIEGDADLKPENILNGVTIFGVEGNLVVDSNDTAMEDMLITRNFSEYTNNRITSLNDYAFCGCINLTSIDLPKCTSIGGSAFYNCQNLTSIDFPKCAFIRTSAFYNCTNLTMINLPKCTSIGSSSAFANCTGLTSIDLPECINVGYYAFDDCSNLTSVNLPKCIALDGNAFAYCSNLISVSLPECKSIYYAAFIGCNNLPSISLPKCTYITAEAFRGCYNLSQIYLMNSSVCTLTDTLAFYSTPFGHYSSYFSGTPYIYVPASLVDAYKSAPKWSGYLSSYISAYNG